MFACLADEMDKMEENTELGLDLQTLVIKSMKIDIKTSLKPNIARLVEEDNADDLEEFLMNETTLETASSSNKKGKKNKNKRNSSKEIDGFSKLGRRIFLYACALDSVECCKLLLESEKFTPVSVDDVDDMDQRSGLHIASFYHNQKSVELLLKKGANSFLLNQHSMTPLEEALLSSSLDVDWDMSTDASEIVRRIGEKDLKVLKTLLIKCNSKDALGALAFKLAKGLKLVPLVALLHARKSIINTLLKSSEVDSESGGTLVDYMLGMILDSSSPNNPDEDSPKLAKCQTNNSEENGVLGVMNSKRIVGAWDDEIIEIKYRKDATEWEEINSKYNRNLAEADVGRKTGAVATESDKISDKCKGHTDSKRGSNRIARKMLECILQFVQSWNPHAKNCLPPLIRAVQANDLELINVLLASSVQVNVTDNDGNTALHWALKQVASLDGRSVNCRIVEKLLDAGAPVTSGNNTGATPVHTAAGHGHLEALFLIITKHGGSINILTGTKETPLHYAVKNNHLPCAALLLRNGANRDVLSLRSQKPIHLARSSEMLALLSLDDRDLLEEACNKIIASQNCIPCSPKSCGKDFTFPDGPSSCNQSISVSHPAASAGSSSSLPVARAVSQSLPEFTEKLQTQPSSQYSASSLQELEQSNSSWQTVQKKSRKQTCSSDPVLVAKEQLPTKTVTLPPYKTVLCRFYGTNKKCEWGINCHFAHSEEELRKGQQVMTLLGQRVETVHGTMLSSNITSDCPKNYKIKLCMHFERNGTCPNGLKCKFAHGQKELRPISAWPSVMPGARIGTRPSTGSSLGSFSSEELDDINSRKVFVGGLPPYITSKELQDFMEQEFGKVVDSTVICGYDEDGVTRSRGFGFVLFENQKDADAATIKHYIPFLGKRVELKKAVSRMELTSGDDLGKQSSSSFGTTLPATTQTHALSSWPSGVSMLVDKLYSGSDAAGYSQCLLQPSISVEQPSELTQDEIQYFQHFEDKAAGYLSESSKQIQKNVQTEKFQNNEAIFPSFRNKSYMESCASYGNNEVHLLTRDAEQLLNLDDTLASSSFHPYIQCSSESLRTFSSSSPPGIYATPFVNSNLHQSNGQPFTYFSSGTSSSYFSSVPEPNNSSHINGRDDEDISQLLELSEVTVRPMPEPTRAKSFDYNPPVSNCGVSQSFLPVSFQNSWNRDVFASCQNLNSQSTYSGKWYGSIEDGTNNELQLSGTVNYPYFSGSSRALSNTSHDLGYNSSFSESFGYDQNYQLPIASQGLGVASSGLNDPWLQILAVSEFKKNISKAPNGHFQELDQFTGFRTLN